MPALNFNFAFKLLRPAGKVNPQKTNALCSKVTMNTKNSTVASKCDSKGTHDTNSGVIVDNESRNYLPYFFRGRVIHGYGRGGRTLNCPTANLEESVVNALPANFENGVYAGFTRLADAENKRLLPMVMSVGYNPQFHNQKKTLEVHILKVFDDDFYGSVVEGVVVSFIRPMQSFKSLTELMEAIESDKNIAKSSMTERLRDELQRDAFFS